MNPKPVFPPIGALLARCPAAIARLVGREENPDIRGSVAFYPAPQGVFVVTRVSGLPTGTGVCDSPVFALHIHNGERCTGTAADPFADAGTHFNPDACPHPCHAGDLPPLFGAGGIAFSAVLTNRFTLPQVMGKPVILHAAPDDFTTQPAGNAGEKIACGIIRPAH